MQHTMVRFASELCALQFTTVRQVGHVVMPMSSSQVVNTRVDVWQIMHNNTERVQRILPYDWSGEKKKRTT